MRKQVMKKWNKMLFWWWCDDDNEKEPEIKIIKQKKWNINLMNKILPSVSY